MTLTRAHFALGLALVAALGGYAASGHPLLPDRPAPPPQSSPIAAPAIAAADKRLLTNQGDIGAWLMLADGLARSGAPARAVDAMQVALSAFPRSPDLWVGLGNALVLHAEGQVTPAARLAFARAAAIDPKHPGPRYFLGLAYLQAGKPADAAAAWESLRRDAPADAPWLADLNERIAAAHMMETMGVGR